MIWDVYIPCDFDIMDIEDVLITPQILARDTLKNQRDTIYSIVTTKVVGEELPFEFSKIIK